MVIRLQKLDTYDTSDTTVHSDQSSMYEDQAQQTTFAPQLTTYVPLQQTTIEEVEHETPSAEPEASETDEDSNDETVSSLGLGLGPRRSSFLTAGRRASIDSISSFDDDGTDSVCSRHGVRRDRSNTWSHSPLAFKTAKRTGSLPPMDGIMTQVPKLNLSEGRNSPYPTGTPTCISPRKYGKLLVCSEHRMSCSPRLPPIGCLSDLHLPHNLPKNSPRELSREVTLIDPALIDNADTTEVRMIGRRRNALMTPQPSSPDSHS